MYRLRVCFIIGFIVICTPLFMVNGYPDGAPESVCDTMVIPHNVTAQTSDSYYMFMFSSTTVNAGETIYVYIMSDYTSYYYEGILVKGIEAMEDVLDYSATAGSFIIDDDDADLYKYLDCSGLKHSAVTHSSSVQKKEVTFGWKAPNKNGTYVLIMSLAKDHDTYWVPLVSAKIYVSAGFAVHANTFAIFIIALVSIIKCL